MLQILHKILAIILAFVVLFSTLSFSVEKHICMGEVTEMSFFTEIDSCKMMVSDCDIDDFSETKMNQKKCCKNVKEFIQGNQTEQQALHNLKINQVQFVLAYVYTYQNLFEQRKDITSFKYYSPQLVDKDINILYQTFLI